jgi:hypothetical protein
VAVGAGVYGMGGCLGSRTPPSVLLRGVALDFEQMVAAGPATDSLQPLHALQGGVDIHGAWDVASAQSVHCRLVQRPKRGTSSWGRLCVTTAQQMPLSMMPGSSCTVVWSCLRQPQQYFKHCLHDGPCTPSRRLLLQPTVLQCVVFGQLGWHAVALHIQLWVDMPWYSVTYCCG